ncbi:MAG: LytTR family transcriptional regulator [Bacteroidales bacterium]|nr:LytTR family transcriptional regulator [Bacteroidales bacterium]
MASIPGIFRRFIPQLLHIVVLPIFFFAFMLIHRSLGIESFLGHEWFGVHLTIVSCIILLCIAVTRIVYYFLPVQINYSLYIFWCMVELIFTSFFVALYLWLVMDKPMPYFEFVTSSFKFLFFTQVFAYVIMSLSLRVYDYHQKASEPEEVTSQRMRFYDNQHNLKLVLMPSSIIYISAEENYVNIFYKENDRVRDYSLRSSMKALDELCQENGLVRCHRSFYINPAQVKVLRKDKDGIMYAEMNADVRHIPVSKTYYGQLSEML